MAAAGEGSGERPFRLAVLVSGEGTNLQAILDQLHGRGEIEVACVGSSKSGARAVERARGVGIETRAFPLEEYADRQARDEAMAEWLASHDVSLVVMAGFMELLTPAFIRRFVGRIINVHPSLLPAFAGLRPIEQALDYGVQVMGVTIHFVDEGVDSGPIILQEAFPVPYPRDIAAIERRVHEVEHELLPRAIRLIARGAVRLDPPGGRQVAIDEEGRE